MCVRGFKFSGRILRSGVFDGPMFVACCWATVSSDARKFRALRSCNIEEVACGAVSLCWRRWADRLSVVISNRKVCMLARGKRCCMLNGGGAVVRIQARAFYAISDQLLPWPGLSVEAGI